MTAWSYSSIKTFDQCPKKYYHLKVAKDVRDEGSTATVYGTEVHLAAEEFIRDGKPVPNKFKFMAPALQALNRIPGEKHCEVRLGVAKVGTTYKPTEFFGADVWWRGVADLIILNEDVAYSVDYKTSKNARYADTKQLDLVAGGVFAKYPQVNLIKSALVFVVSGDVVKKTHTRVLRDSYMATFAPELDRLKVAEETNVWNPVSGPLCAYCPVTSCAHNRRR